MIWGGNYFVEHRLPHMRGDEPLDQASIVYENFVCPTCVGMNRRKTERKIRGRRVCPTCVGMNR